MSTSDSPTVIHIDVPPNERNLTFDHLFAPMAQSADKHLSGGTLSPEVAALVQQMRDLTTQLNSVIAQINQLAPGLLSGAPNP